MTSEEMEPDVDPPLLPLQGARVRPPIRPRHAGTTAYTNTTSNTTTSKPSPISSTRQPSRRIQQPVSQRGKGNVSRLPASAKSATRVASQARRPIAPAGPKRPTDYSASTPPSARVLGRSTRDSPPSTFKPVMQSSGRTNLEQAYGLTRARTTSETEKWDITPDGGSAGREGRQFAVSNVGNNGRIYLRPTVRPARERLPQPNFVFPITPPQTAGLGSTARKPEAERKPDALDIARLHDSYWTAGQGPTTPNQPLQSFLLDDRNSNRPALRRAVSDSTIRESSAARESDVGGFKIVITKPGDERRPKTVEDIDSRKVPLLEILIPSGKLGTPRWSARGTPFIRGSSYAPTEEYRSSHHSPLTPRFPSSLGLKAQGSMTLRPVRYSGAPRSPLHNSRAQSVQHALRSTYMSTHMKIEPTMFDSLTFKPACDDRSIVRYSALTGAVTAATPPRLVAEITSPSFLDYELLSDFFLTFRFYLAPLDLVKMLFARMRWALARHDEVGTVVRVRTFVALRHWILNYFVDDFVCEYEMRTTFCTLLNSLSEEMSVCHKARRVQLKILAELKKCWRRVCAQFWDGPEFDVNLPPVAPITPGGIPGHRNPSLDPEFWKQFFPDAEEPPRLDAVYAPLTSNPPDFETSFVRDVARAGADEADYIFTYRPGTPDRGLGEKDAIHEAQWSPTSLSSAEVVSCSLPFRFAPVRSKHSVAAHPVDQYSMQAVTQPVAPIPRTLAGKLVRPHQAHKRNNSTSDSLREHNATLEQLIQKNTETILSIPYSGSLVRGNVLPPGQAFVEIRSPTSRTGQSRQTTFLRIEADASTKEQSAPAAMSGHGMRRLIGSVRRALSNRGQDMSPTQGNFNISPIGPRGVTANRLPGTAIVPQSRPANSSRLPVRIDLLGAEIVEDFKRVVREDAEEAAARSFHGSIPSTPTTVRSPITQADLDSANIDSLLQDPQEDGRRARAFSDGGVTSGSKSILIIDDTLRGSDEQPTMVGALPAFTPSVEAFADSFLPSNADPTPPSTPPGRNIDTPRRSSYLLGQRRSSYLLGQHVLRSARSADDLPPFVPDLDSLTGGSSMRSSEYPQRPSMHPRRRSSEYDRQSSSRPPLTGMSRQARHRSSRSNLRRHASFHSGMGRRSTVRSFDATTYSDRNSSDVSAGDVPPPLRVLRRRPGGDLRAVTNIVDLGPTVLRRSRSIGSLTTGTFTTSVGTSLIQSSAMAHESTGLLEIVSSEYSRDRAGTFSLGMLAEKPKARRRISLLSTFSSKPIMRPSFEAEAQKLANIPDDDDDGGVESALLKLEGKYEKKPFRLSMEPSKSSLRKLKQDISQPAPSEVEPSSTAEKKKHRHEHIVDDGVVPFTPPPNDSPPLPPLESSIVVVGQEEGQPVREERVEVRSIGSDISDDSYTSIPLLRRGLTDDGRRSRVAWVNRSILQDADEDGATSADDDEEDRRGESYEVVEKSASIEQIKPGDTMPTRQRSDTRVSQQSQGSFLNMDDSSDDDDDDELSSELSETPLEEDDDDSMMAFPTLRPNASLTKIRTAESRVHPMKSERSPPVQMAQELAMSPPYIGGIPELHSAQIYGTKPLPPTPDYTPTFGHSGATMKRPSPDPTGVNASMRNAAQVIEQETGTRKYSAHLPFILAFESEVLAQQFTLIEKDALNEIDWKELIDMRWKNAENNDARSWVHFLRDTDAQGIEVVIARFNIVVKWAISEIVLTKNMEERARCIIKYIHIAAHCRRYRNFATMSQFAVALTSVEVARLTETWKLVPPQDIRTLRELETLISPTRNFYALRAEMEGGGLVGAGTGCIPFVGIYTHDLIFNSQRPCEIASSPTTAPLVNFERCRIAAGIVKALLRLLEASTLYSFEPIEGITERCLWMSALSDEEIRRHSEGLE